MTLDIAPLDLPRPSSVDDLPGVESVEHALRCRLPQLRTNILRVNS